MNVAGVKVGRASEGAHWYLPDGTALYEVPRKKPGKNGETHRAATLRDARPVGAFYGVTNVTSEGANKGLENWKNGQWLLAALTSPRLADYSAGRLSDEAFVKEVAEEAGKTAEQAAEFGTRVHEAVANDFRGLEYDADLKPFVAGIRHELNMAFPTVDAGAWLSEIAFANSALGFGGKVDLHAVFAGTGGIVVDFKGVEAIGDKPPVPYDAYQMQLAAYRYGLQIHDANCYVLYFSRSQPGKTALVEVGMDDLMRGWTMFASLLAFKKARCKYDPVAAS